MSQYEHKVTSFSRLLSKSLRALARLIRRWPLVLLVVCIISPISPHMLWEYRYQVRGTQHVKTECTYLGFRGYVRVAAYGDCAFFDIFDTRGRE